jgi:predicted FMN-binding regulatory protein PaiB
VYIPQHFRENDPARLEKLIDTYPFGTLITLADGRPFATHLPFIYERDAGLLLAHVARANPQSRQLEGKFKLSQNRSAADRAAVTAKLVARGGDDDLALARLIESAGAGAAD